jgi:hypothetical protein
MKRASSYEMKYLHTPESKKVLSNTQNITTREKCCFSHYIYEKYLELKPVKNIKILYENLMCLEIFFHS